MKLIKRKKLFEKKPQRIKTLAISADMMQRWLEQQLPAGMRGAALPFDESRIIGCWWGELGYVNLTIECPSFDEVPAGEFPPILTVHYSG